MYLIDSHCHLHDREFFSDSQAEEMLKNADKNDVKQIVCIGTSHDDSLVAQQFALAHDNVFWTYGIHPEDGTNNNQLIKIAQAKELIRARENDKLVAIGEIGLDYHRDGYSKQVQWKLLETMLNLAIELDLPCSFHVRDAIGDFFGIAKNFPRLKPSILHSFTDTKENLEKAINKGFYIGFNGIATFANLDCFRGLNAGFLAHCVLETDAPFLTPEPKRGKINEPGNIMYIAEYLATKTGVSLQEVADKTTNNVRKIFSIQNP